MYETMEDIGNMGAKFWKVSKKEQNEFLDQMAQEMLDGEGRAYGVYTILCWNLDKKRRIKYAVKLMEICEKGFKYQDSTGETIEEFISEHVIKFIMENCSKKKDNEIFYKKLEEEKSILDKLYKENDQLYRDMYAKKEEIHNKIRDMNHLKLNIAKTYIKK